jgi:predicted DNA-binding transcriptional regulator YafY
MKFGGDAEVLEPRELRDRLAASARAVLDLYR